MSALPELQKKFIHGVLQGGGSILPDIRAVGALTPEQRMQIYRNNTFFILTDNLKATFPATAALGSEGFFRYAAREFIKSDPPESGDMNAYGASFPAFLREAGMVQDHLFLADVTELEWLRQESYMAADESAAPLHPSLRLFSSPWPVVQLWKLGKGQISVEEIDMDKGENAVIFRRGGGIEMWSIDANSFAFIKAFAEGRDFEAPEGFDPLIHIQNLKEAELLLQKGISP